MLDELDTTLLVLDWVRYNIMIVGWAVIFWIKGELHSREREYIKEWEKVTIKKRIKDKKEVKKPWEQIKIQPLCKVYKGIPLNSKL